ncbi:radical SAM protein [bacterium]|nr:radical SAM protein [bacterium]
MNLQSFTKRYQLFRGLVNGRIARTDPFFIDIDVTNRCNLRCLGCIYHSAGVTHLDLKSDDTHDIPLETIERLCRDLDSAKTPLVVLQGAGEPMLHPRIIDIITMLKRQGFTVSLITNGTKLSRDMNRRLIESELDVLKVSIWALTREQYSLNYPGADPDNYLIIRDALSDLRSLKAQRSSPLPRLHFYIPINRFNYRSLAMVVTLADECRAANVIFAPMADITGELGDTVLPRREEQAVKKELKTISRQLKARGISDETDLTFLRYRLKDALWKYFPCTIAWYHARIRTDGSVQSCGRCDSEVIFGNINDSSFQDIWNGPAIQEFRYQRLWQLRNDYWAHHCACATCCFVRDMRRIDNVFKWIRPVLRPFRKRAS